MILSSRIHAEYHIIYTNTCACVLRKSHAQHCHKPRSRRVQLKRHTVQWGPTFRKLGPRWDLIIIPVNLENHSPMHTNTIKHIMLPSLHFSWCIHRKRLILLLSVTSVIVSSLVITIWRSWYLGEFQVDCPMTSHGSLLTCMNKETWHRWTQTTSACTSPCR